MDEMAAEAHLSDEKAKKAMIDAARLADELRQEQELAQAYERDKKLLESQVIILEFLATFQFLFFFFIGCFDKKRVD